MLLLWGVGISLLPCRDLPLVVDALLPLTRRHTRLLVMQLKYCYLVFDYLCFAFVVVSVVYQMLIITTTRKVR